MLSQLWVIGIAISVALSKLTGDHICEEEETYTVNVTEHFTRNATVRNYQWCYNYPPRCSVYSIVKVNDTRLVERNRTRNIEKCCPGFMENDSHDGCISMCTRCVEGVCDYGKCICRTGFQGEDCSTACEPLFWGADCKLQCLCEHDGTCNPQTGHCVCPPGWNGTRCELRCENDYFGIGCNKKCSCNKNEICDSKNGECRMQTTLIPSTPPIPNHVTKTIFYSDEEFLNVTLAKLSNPELRKTPTFQKYHTFDIDFTRSITTPKYSKEIYFSSSGHSKPTTIQLINNGKFPRQLEKITNNMNVQSYNTNQKTTSKPFQKTSTIATDRADSRLLGDNRIINYGPKSYDIDKFSANKSTTDKSDWPTEEPETNLRTLPVSNEDSPEITTIPNTSKIHLVAPQTAADNTTFSETTENASTGKKLNTVVQYSSVDTNPAITNISVVVAIAAIIILIIILAILVHHYIRKKRRKCCKIEVQKSKNGPSVSVYTHHSIFHTPLPEPPTFENPIFAAPVENNSNERTFETRVVCSLNFPKHPVHDPREYTYDHPPSTGSYRAASLPEPPELGTDILQPDPLYDEIPITDVISQTYSPPPSYKSSCIYMNTCGKTRF